MSMRENSILYEPRATVKFDICAYNCSTIDVSKRSCGGSRSCKRPLRFVRLAHMEQTWLTSTYIKLS